MDSRLRERCEHQFRRLHRSVRLRLLVHALVTWLALTMTAGLALLLVLGAAEPVRWVRLGLVGSAAALAVLLSWSLLWSAWRQLRSRAAVARRLDRAGDYADTLAAAEEALRRPDRWRTDTPVREALVGRLLARASRLAAELSLPRLLPVVRPATVFGLMLLALGAGFWAVSSVPELVGGGWRILGASWSAPRVSTGQDDLRLVWGPAHAVAGSAVTVAAIDLIGGIEPVQCEVRAGSGLWRGVPARQVPQPGADPVLGAPFQRWEAVLDDLQEDLVYRFRRGPRLSTERDLAVWRPPLLARLAARVDPPAYTGLGPQVLDRLPAYVEAPEGSRLTLDGRSSQTLRAAAAVSAEGDSLALTVDGDRLRGSFDLTAPRRFRLVLEDQRGLAGSSELVYELAVVADRTPLVRLQRPDDDGRLPLAAPLLLLAAADDDYGLVGMDLLLRRGDQDGGAWVADLPGGGRPAADQDGWERIPLLVDAAEPFTGVREMPTSLGALPLRIIPREAATSAGRRLELILQAGDLALVSGDVLELVLEASDNRRPGPPAVGRSAILRLQVPSSLELLQARDESDSSNRNDLDELRRRSEELSADLERLRRELMKDPSPDWDRRQELQAAVERQQQLQAEMSRLADAMQRDLESLAENRLTSPEIMQKMDTIAELMAEAKNSDMEQVLKQLRAQLEQMSAKELSLSMEDLARSQSEMMRRLDTARSMLEDLAREQEMEGLTDLVAEMLSKQQELAEASRQVEEPAAEAAEADESEPQDGENTDGENTEGEEAEGPQSDSKDAAEAQDADAENQDADAENQDADTEELARRQESLAREMEELEERLRETLAEMQEQAESQDGEQSAAEEEMQKALSEALEQMAQQQTDQTMQEAGEKLKQELSQEAAEQMQQALTDLAGLYHVMLRSQMAMKMAMQAEQAGQMRDLAADLLTLSQRQEQLGLDLPTSLRDIRVDDLARRQHVILQGAIAVRDGLEAVAGAAPQDILRMLDQLDGLLEGMGRALGQLEDGRAHGARLAADASLAEMNRIVIQLLTQAEMTGQGGGSGSPQPMLSQQLQQMAQEQSGLNAMAEQLRQQQGRLSQELRAGMKRLQQGQEGLAGMAGRLAEEEQKRAQQDGSRLLGDLEHLAAEMQGVGDDLAGGLITEETLRRQERILSRLLDMHNASRERDWARRRESRSAEDVFAEQEGRTGSELDDQPLAARRWRPVEEAPPAYRDLVRDYFREVQRLHDLVGRDARGQRLQRGGTP